MSALVLLDFFYEMRKSDKMLGLLSISLFFHNKFDQFNNTRSQMLVSFYHMTLKITLKFQFLHEKVKDFATIELASLPLKHGMN